MNVRRFPNFILHGTKGLALLTFPTSPTIMKKKRNLLIIGASGGVASAFLRKIAKHRENFSNLVLIDKKDGLLHDPFIPHGQLEYVFINTTIDVKKDRAAYNDLLRTYSVDVVVDLSINETRPILETTDAAGVSYVNTGIANRRGESFADVVFDIYKRRSLLWNSPHILCTGMNPGIVNMWVRQGIESFGVPNRIVHFEYDTGQPVQGWLPVITWSRETFLDEIINDPAGYMDGKDRLKFLYPNPLKNRVSMMELLRPIMELKEYPRGFLLLHEENITIAQRYDIPSRFIFAINSRTMDYLEVVYDEKGSVPVEMISLGDNKAIGLKGSITVGVLLDYGDRKVYFFNTTSHANVRGVTGSCWQVGAGLYAAILALLTDPLANCVYFIEDLFGTSYKRFMADSLPVQELVIDKYSHQKPNLRGLQSL